MTFVYEWHGKNRRIPNLVKWAGGKSSSMKNLLQEIPTNFNNYYEPFFGGGSLFWTLKNKKKISHAIISDVNGDLINLLLAVKDKPMELSAELEKYRSAAGAEEYYRIRKKFNGCGSTNCIDTERAAMFLYLNRNGYNGLWRTNKTGKYNVPYGGYKRFYLANNEDLELYSTLLKDTTIMNASYPVTLENAENGDFVFLDPPYFREKNSNFVQYNATSFTERDHLNLKNTVEELTNRGVKVMVTNRYCDEIKAIFSSFKMTTFRNRKQINRIGSARMGFNEVMITNF